MNTRNTSKYSCFLVALALVSTATVPAAAVDRIAVGEPAPKFELKDQEGKPQSLDELLKNGPVALVFYRSASWCPHCRRHLIDIQSKLETIAASGVQIVAISPDQVKVLSKVAAQHKFTFPLLADLKSKTIHAYGLHFKDGLPHPGTVVIDADGVVRAMLFREGYSNRHPVQELIDTAGELGFASAQE